MLSTADRDILKDVSRTALVPLGVHVAEMRLPRPDDLILRNKPLLISNLLKDFVKVAGQCEDWWPWHSASDHLYSNKIGAKSLSHPNVASFSSCVGLARGDSGLVRLGRAAYIDTLAILRHYKQDKYIQQIGIILVLMTNDMI